MTYEELYTKWANRPTYDCPLIHSKAGRIKVYRSEDYPLAYMSGYRVVADIWLLPTMFGWGYDEKKRREFYKDAKAAKLSRRKETKSEWYKIIEIHEQDLEIHKG